MVTNRFRQCQFPKASFDSRMVFSERAFYVAPYRPLPAFPAPWGLMTIQTVAF